MSRKKPSSKQRKRVTDDVHALYEAAVQCVEADVDFVDRVYRKRNGRPPRDLREDFCGTAAMACEWVRRGRKRRAWGVDLDEDTLRWGRDHRVAPLGDAADRVILVRSDVRSADVGPVDVVVALNFSYFVFHERRDLLDYFRHARRSLHDGGLLCLDIFGGTESMADLVEKSPKPASRQPDGRKVPAFTYIWEQASFNAVDHRVTCRIHFKLRDGRKIKNAFRYDWRMWTLPEIRDALLEAGFDTVDVYAEGWDDDTDESDGIFRKKRRFENEGGWIAYVVAG